MVGFGKPGNGLQTDRTSFLVERNNNYWVSFPVVDTSTSNTLFPDTVRRKVCSGDGLSVGIDSRKRAGRERHNRLNRLLVVAVALGRGRLSHH